MRPAQTLLNGGEVVGGGLFSADIFLSGCPKFFFIASTRILLIFPSKGGRTLAPPGNPSQHSSYCGRQGNFFFSFILF